MSERQLCQAFSQLRSLALTNSENDFTIDAKVLTYDTWLHVFYNMHNPIHHWVCKLVCDGFFNQPFLYLSMVNGIGGGSTISYNKTARTEVNSTIIAYHDNQNVCKTMTVYLSEYRFACRRRRLTIVVCPKVVTFCSKNIGIATMTRIIIFLAVGGNYVHCLLHCFYMMRKR